jgi:hypothetical protein
VHAGAGRPGLTQPVPLLPHGLDAAVGPGGVQFEFIDPRRREHRPAGSVDGATSDSGDASDASVADSASLASEAGADAPVEGAAAVDAAADVASE